jgi:hypothetical protein
MGYEVPVEVGSISNIGKNMVSFASGIGSYVSSGITYIRGGQQ